MMSWRVLILLLYFSPSSGVRRLVGEFVHNAGTNLSHLAVDDLSEQIYVAGTNILYQLDDSLRVRHRVETGKIGSVIFRVCRRHLK